MTTSIDVLSVIDAAIKRLNDSIPVGEAWSGAQLDEEDDLLEARAAVAELIAFAESFSFTVTDSFYKDAYLGINFPQGESNPHGKKIVYRFPTPSNISPDMAEIERMRASALDRVKGEQP